MSFFDLDDTRERLRSHVSVLTEEIGERSVMRLGNLAQSADYIASVHRDAGRAVSRQTYPFKNAVVANIVAEVSSAAARSTYIVGAHYDSMAGTVGADDNASAVAVQLELARIFQEIILEQRPDLKLRFVSFALEEPPAFETPHMGSRVYAEHARATRERIDGMICLEMVGFTCRQPGCQHYPFPFSYFNFPDTGDFIGIVGNLRSWPLTRRLARAFRRNPDLPVISQTVPLSGRFVPTIRLSDHAPFWDNGYRAVMITDTAFYRNPNYHTSSDTIDTLDFDFMAELVESLALFFLNE